MERKTKSNNHPQVCLLSTHPLLLEEFTRKLSQSHFTVRPFRLHQVFFEDVNRLEIPSASVYIVDGHDPFAPVLARALVNRFPDSAVIVLSDKFTDSTAFPLLDVGVKGLLDYAQASTHLAEAVNAVAHGSYWVERRLLSSFKNAKIRSSRRLSRKARLPRLSPREREVLEAVLENLSNKEIARKLNISERTAKFHVSNLLAKFEVKRRVDLIMLRLQNQRP